MTKTYFENLISLIQDELKHHRYKYAYEDASKLPPCNLTNSLIHDFQNSTPYQVYKDLMTIKNNEANYIE